MEWCQILGIILVAIFIDCAIGAVIYSILEDKLDVFIPMPSDLKYNTDMNWFGCIVCYIGLFILFPILNICKVVYWLFHI